MNGMKEVTLGVKINGQKVHSMRFADDIAFLAETEEEINGMLNILSEKLVTYKFTINAKKTKTMFVLKDSRNMNPATQCLGNRAIQQVEEFCYLGSIISHNNKTCSDAKIRIAMAKQKFMKKYSLLTSKHINIQTRKNIVNTFVWSLLLYGCEIKT